MSDSAWAYLMIGAFCLGIDHGMEPPEKANLRGTAWHASLLLLWPAVLTLGAARTACASTGWSTRPLC